MCGITGFINQTSGHDPRAAANVVAQMCRVMAHRGPDDQGLLATGRAALGMRRLSIIDLAGGHQPLSGCDPALSIIFNGEIYNYRELQRALEARGHQFHTRADTEGIVHAYEEYGAACVEHLRGMFAFAIWDERAGTLFLARDRVGEKPLYYTVTAQGTFVFGSELKCLLAHPEVERRLDPEALDAYLTYGYVPEPLSIFRDIHRLPAGYHLTVGAGRMALQQYWDFQYELSAPRRADDYLAELRALLDESVRLRLVADVPLGAFLSGGVDSSTIVGLMARHTTQPVKTFSIGFREDRFNELPYARVAAKHFGTEHHELIVTPDICQLVDELVWHFDEPFADESALPTYLVSKLARAHVKVVLSGDGGDELFAGYTRYVTDRHRRGFARLPRFIRQGVLRPVSQLLPHGARGRNYLYNIAHDPIARYLDSISTFSALNKRSLYTTEFQHTLGAGTAATERFRAHAARMPTGDPLDTLLYLDSKTYLPSDILTKVDRMSMAVSLEARVPLLDHKLIEFVTRIPAALKMSETETKHIFKRAVRGLVPDEILDRPKQGFGVPLVDWLNRELRERLRDTFADARTRQRGYVEPRHVDLLLAEHERGRRDHARALWALLMLEQWQRTYMDGNGLPLARQTDETALLTVVGA